MTDEQINQRIAEACGLICLREFQADKDGAKFGFWEYPSTWTGPKKQPWCLDFCTDLNAMAEAEKVLTIPQEKDYFLNLEEIVGDLIWFRSSPKSHRATARQRAEAFLRALGKWEEVEG